MRSTIATNTARVARSDSDHLVDVIIQRTERSEASYLGVMPPYVMRTLYVHV